VGDIQRSQSPRQSQATMLAELLRKKVIRVSIPMLDQNGSISSGFAALFDLSGAERKAIDEYLSSVRKDYDSLLAAHTTIARNANGGAEIKVDPFPEEGGRLYDRLNSEFEAILGKERNAAFAALAGTQVEDAFDHFGSQVRNFSFAYKRTADGSIEIAIADRQNLGGEQRSQTSEFSNFPAFAKRFPSIAKLLPDDLKSQP
jgi:hypothetical protein